ncbi:MAG: FMN-binding protein [Elusimicrobiota bacterium]
MRSSLFLVWFAASAALLSAALADAADSSRERALQRAFPAAAVERRTAYLSAAQLTTANENADSTTEIESRIWTYYVGSNSAGVVGFAYFDRLIIRAAPAVIMTVVAPDGRLRSIEAVEFNGPPERAPTRAFLKGLRGMSLGSEIRLGAGVDGISGATYTSMTLVDAARRALAIHSVLHP